MALGGGIKRLAGQVAARLVAPMRVLVQPGVHQVPQTAGKEHGTDQDPGHGAEDPPTMALDCAVRKQLAYSQSAHDPE